MQIGIVGGTGREGRGLALRWARAGHAVAIGSRSAERAVQKAAVFSEEAGVSIRGGGNPDIVASAEVVILAVPYGAHRSTLEGLVDALRGKIVVDITVPLKPPKVRRVHLPAGRAAALEAQAILGPDTPVVSTLHHVSSAHLGDPEHVIDCDVLVCGDRPAAREVVVGLLGDLGLRGLHAGPLDNAVALEALTPVLLFLNKRYKSPGAGLRITALPDA